MQEIKIRELVIDNVVSCTLMDGDYVIDVIKSKFKDVYNFIKALKRNH